MLELEFSQVSASSAVPPGTRRAHWLSCRHLGDELLWEGLVPIPVVGEFTYRLAVVNESFVVLKWASERHTVVLPEGLEDGAIGEQGAWGGARGATSGVGWGWAAAGLGDGASLLRNSLQMASAQTRLAGRVPQACDPWDVPRQRSLARVRFSAVRAPLPTPRCPCCRSRRGRGVDGRGAPLPGACALGLCPRGLAQPQRRQRGTCAAPAAGAKRGGGALPSAVSGRLPSPAVLPGLAELSAGWTVVPVHLFVLGHGAVGWAAALVLVAFGAVPPGQCGVLAGSARCQLRCGRCMCGPTGQGPCCPSPILQRWGVKGGRDGVHPGRHRPAGQLAAAGGARSDSCDRPGCLASGSTALPRHPCVPSPA